MLCSNGVVYIVQFTSWISSIPHECEMMRNENIIWFNWENKPWCQLPRRAALYTNSNSNTTAIEVVNVLVCASQHLFIYYFIIFHVYDVCMISRKQLCE